MGGTYRYGLVINASSIVSNAECAIICNSYLFFLPAPAPATPPADPPDPVVAPAELALPDVASVVVGILASNPPNILPLPPPCSAVDVFDTLYAPAEEVEDEDAVLGVISVS